MRLLRMVDNLGRFSGWWFSCNVKFCHVFQSFLGVTHTPAGHNEYLSSLASQPGNLHAKITRKTKKPCQNLSLHKNHHPEKRPKLSTILSSALKTSIFQKQYKICEMATCFSIKIWSSTKMKSKKLRPGFS